MIKIEATNGRIIVEGHAEYAPHGQDIVCAAISTLVQNLVISLAELTTTDLMYSMKDGAINEIHTGTLSYAGHILVESFFIGVEAIAEHYSDNVQVNRSKH